MALKDLIRKGKPPQMPMGKKVEVGYAVITAKGKLRIDGGRLPIFWTRDQADDLMISLRLGGSGGEKVVKVTVFQHEPTK